MKEDFPPFPKPTKTIDDEEYWDACNQHKLVIQQCKSCKKLRHPPKPVCSSCQSFEFEWHEVPGTGEIFTWTTTFYEASPKYEEYLPYSMAVIDLNGTLDQDILLISHIVGSNPEEIEVGERVSVVWEDITEDISLPLFELK